MRKTAPLLFRFPFGDNGSTARIKTENSSHRSRQHKQELASLLKDMGYSTYYWAELITSVTSKHKARSSNANS